MALIAILMIMFVGVIAAALVAGAVMFTIRSNVANENTTQAYIAAESGRDAALANVLASTCTLTASNPRGGGGSAPFYEATVDHCPSPTSGDTFQIVSTGWDENGESTTITSDYSRVVTYKNQPGGSLAYFDGTFTVTQSSYTGTVVVRQGNYDCSTAKSTIDGDLWVVNGSVDLSSGCTVTGSVYARDDVEMWSNDVTVGGRITAGRDVILSANNLSIGMSPSSPREPGDTDVRAGGNVTITSPRGQIGGTVIAGGTYTGSASVTIGGAEPLDGQPNAAVFTPTLQQVYDMTTWVDVSADRAQWGDDVHWYAVPSGQCAMDLSTQLTTALPSGKSRLGVDYSSCGGNVTVKVNSNKQLPHDAILIVPPNRTVRIDITGTLTSPAGKSTQMFVIHADAVPDSEPTCVNGSASDRLVNVPADGIRLMVYTACGVPRLTGSFKDTFYGQFYAGNPGGVDWVQPEFVCQPMEWEPLIDLSCALSEAGTGEHGTIVQVQKPVLMHQVED
ncbi:hypothetical protein [Microbacterium awajiense]|uniref:hypothetical protein n=1 Tax=Microbacterium awajiense TaxID=415214 RepID=UPI0031D56377